MVRQLEEIEDILLENTNRDEKGRDIILFNLMSGSCSRQCPNCYDRAVKKEMMKPDTFNHYLKLTRDVHELPNSNVSDRISTIASRMIEYPYLRQYLDTLTIHGMNTSVYVSDLGNGELMHPAIDLIFFHITDNIEKEIDAFKALESAGKRMDLRFNFVLELN